MAEVVGVIGAGIMGNGIAQVFAMAGFEVVMIDVAQAALDKSMDTMRKNLDRLVKKGTLDAEAAGQAHGRVRATTSYADLKPAHCVIEAATENLDLKRTILQKVAEVVSPACVIASNTSSISLTQLAASISGPQRVAGMHFSNPVPLMALVEIIAGLQTSQETLDTVVALSKKIGKTPIVVRNGPGFVLNRILCPMINEAIFVLQDGMASASDIDQTLTLGANQPIGPLALADLIGLDTLLAIMEVLYRDFADQKYRPAPLLKEYVAAGYLGRKSGRGFHVYAK